MVNNPQPGDLTVWHVPQMPMKAFYWSVDSVQEGMMVMDLLCKYDLFQYEHNVKPDYANMCGLTRYEDDGEGGFEWFDVDEYEIEELLGEGAANAG